MKPWPLVVATCAVLCVGSPAMAQTQAEGQSDAHYPEAKRRMQEGKALYERGQFDQARMKYAQACTLMRTFSCLRSLGAAETKTGHFVEAYGHLTEILHDPKAQQLPADVRQKLEDLKQTAYDATGHLVVGAPVGSTVWLDGTAAGTAPLADPLAVTPGKHTLEVRGADGGQHADVEAVAGKSLEVDLHPAVSAVPPGPAGPAQPAPAAPAAPAPAGPDPFGTEQPATHASFWTPNHTWGTAVVGVGVVSLVVGSVLAVQTQQDANRVSSLSAGLGPSGCVTGQAPGCAELQGARSDQSRDFTLMAVFLGAGSAAVIGGAALFFWPQHQSTTATLVPMVSPQGAGIQLRGEL